MYIPDSYGRTWTPQFISASKISLFPVTMTMLESEEIWSFAIISREWNMILNAATWQYNSGCACFLLSYLP